MKLGMTSICTRIASITVWKLAVILQIKHSIYSEKICLKKEKTAPTWKYFKTKICHIFNLPLVRNNNFNDSKASTTSQYILFLMFFKIMKKTCIVLFFSSFSSLKMRRKKKKKGRGEKGELRTHKNCLVFKVQTVQGLTLFKFIFKTDTLVQSHFHSFQLEKEPYLLTSFFSLQTKHLGSVFHLPNTSHRAAFQAAGARPSQGPCPHSELRDMLRHCQHTSSSRLPGSQANLSWMAASMGILEKVCTQKPRPAFTIQFSS